ncbi:twitching motility protein PilT [Mesorhizobium sp. L-8-10]|uniref:type II toxin-antitoxin system VapC family toxin n=1 Tax=unclassified Mesorhizobium TaxID=325217 RepID=UPI001928D4AC|nr:MULTISPECIES: type II toxin-antitoxin system VapC family toxin [unclassified Mesorhizobium]BCH23900.1 twitching motility protein PilT [Mesorhizobium sp. L-8-3]BCH31634.1 twitching motility protein PilT [Mesorhizobium sp. L-8-10]
MPAIYMLDTNICSFIMRERPASVLARLQNAAESQHQIVISVITYYEMLLGTVGRNASPRHARLVDAFVTRLSTILPWDAASAERATGIKQDLAAKGTPIGGNDTMIAGHALAADCVLVTNNTREFSRVQGLRFEDWVKG